MRKKRDLIRKIMDRTQVFFWLENDESEWTKCVFCDMFNVLFDARICTWLWFNDDWENIDKWRRIDCQWWKVHMPLFHYYTEDFIQGRYRRCPIFIQYNLLQLNPWSANKPSTKNRSSAAIIRDFSIFWFLIGIWLLLS